MLRIGFDEFYSSRFFGFAVTKLCLERNEHCEFDEREMTNAFTGQICRSVRSSMALYAGKRMHTESPFISTVLILEDIRQRRFAAKMRAEARNRETKLADATRFKDMSERESHRRSYFS